MNDDKNGDLFPVRQLKGKSLPLTQKEITLLQVAQRSGVSLEATAKLILVLRARKKAANVKKNQDAATPRVS
ncbi:MAG: hypothetical protein M3O33_02410 [Cyanobacteriota bacterium]|jgi:hypothetical protein|nr:hypothetical protein [Cyanobacteriota bacterium]